MRRKGNMSFPINCIKLRHIYMCLSLTCTHVGQNKSAKQLPLFLSMSQFTAYVRVQLLSGHLRVKRGKKKKRRMWRGNPLQYAKIQGNK